MRYAATAYTDLLAGLGVAIGMEAVGDPEENGFTGRLMRTIREEEIDLSEYRDLAEACARLGRFLDEVYNRKRIRLSLGYLTPAEFEQQWLKGRSVMAQRERSNRNSDHLCHPFSGATSAEDESLLRRRRLGGPITDIARRENHVFGACFAAVK